MEIALVLILLSFSLALVGLAAFWWSCKTGQFSDCTTPGLRILFEDITPAPNQRKDQHVK